MSRSIHTTRKTLRQLTKAVLANQEGAIDRLEKAWLENHRKRRMKKVIRQERSVEEPFMFGAAASSIPIEILDESPEVWHPAGEADLRAVLAKLPEAARDGISRVQLSLGKFAQEEHVATHPEADCLQDPLVGRPGDELFPGVYVGCILGRYLFETGLVQVYGFVVDEKRLPLPIGACRLYLRLNALCTFVHEVAHHHDKTARVRRGRWMADQLGKVENYAERMEYKWTREIVVPYLETTYPGETEELLSWVEHQGGIRLHLQFIAGDPRMTERSGSQNIIYSASDAFEEWLEGAAKWPDLKTSRIAFAEELLFARQFKECLSIVETVLKAEPGCLKATTLQAEALVHLKRFEEAERILTPLLQREPQSEDISRITGDLLEGKRKWNALLQHCERSLRWVTPDSKFRLYLLRQQATAFCALNDTEKMGQTIEEMRRTGAKRPPEYLKWMVQRLAGKETGAGASD